MVTRNARMRLSICCGCVIDSKGRIGLVQKQNGIAIELQTEPSAPVREQPTQSQRVVESIGLETLTGSTNSIFSRLKVSKKVKHSTFTKFNGELTKSPPLDGHINAGFSGSSESIPKIVPSQLILDSPLSDCKSIVKSTANFNYTSKTGKQRQMTFEQIAPNHYRGEYKNIQFTILNGELLSNNYTFNDFEKNLILKNYLQAILAVQQGVAGLESKILNSLNQKLPTINRRRLSELTIPNKSQIKVNFTAENGDKFLMTFKQIKPGLFRGTCNKKLFSIANGQVLPLRKADSDLNKELILNTFLRAVMGMQQTELGLHREEWAMETKLSGNQLNPIELLKAACPERRLLFETESLRIHNDYRRIHGVPPLVHSELLCQMAREWAEHLALKDTTRKRPNDENGENLFHSHGVPLDAKEIISHWYNEINLYDFKRPRFSEQTEHFTQLVWKDSRELGTGIAQLGDKIWVCCYYHPPGNGISMPFEEFVLRPSKLSK